MLNADDEASRLLTRLDAPVLAFGLQTKADVMGEIIERQRAATFCLRRVNCAGADAMIGDHHVATAGGSGWADAEIDARPFADWKRWNAFPAGWSSWSAARALACCRFSPHARTAACTLRTLRKIRLAG